MHSVDSTNKMDKKELRLEIKKKIKNLSRAYCQYASSIINGRVIALDGFKNANTIFVFVGVDGEPDTREIIASALENGKRVCVPLCIGDGLMDAKLISDFDDLQCGAYNLLEPKAELETVRPEEIDFAVVPCVTCNHQGDRLGHGKGFYDRYLEGKHFDTVMICFEKLVTEVIPTDKYDKKIDLVVTEA